MKPKPILFSGPMVRALLDGSKTQTRRIMKPQPSDYVPGPNVHKPVHRAPYFDAYCGAQHTDANPRGMTDHWCWWSPDNRQGPDWIRCPYGIHGDLLWVRETWSCLDSKPSAGTRRAYRADTADGERVRVDAPWCPSIHMPRWASRLTLEVTDIRVERLQDISEEDALAEGIKLWDDGFHWEPNTEPFGAMRLIGLTAKQAYMGLWEDISGCESLEANPWVWALTFKVHKQNVDALLSDRGAA
jgi:hypothetical protein